MIALSNPKTWLAVVLMVSISGGFGYWYHTTKTSRRLFWLHSVQVRFYRWLFGTPTTVLEAINICYLLIWATAILDDDLASLPFYAGFLGGRAAHVNDKASLLFFAAAALNVAGLVRGRRKEDQGAAAIQGFALQLSALLWLAVSLNFFASYPPLHITVLTYGVLAFFCWVSGRYLHRYFQISKQVSLRGE